MCVCICVLNMYMYIRTCVFILLFICLSPCVCVCVSVKYVHVRTCVLLYVCVRTCVLLYVCSYVRACLCVCVFVCSYVHLENITPPVVVSITFNFIQKRATRRCVMRQYVYSNILISRYTKRLACGNSQQQKQTNAARHY